jgi:hypothetical protein
MDLFKNELKIAGAIFIVYPSLRIRRKKQILWLKPFQNTHKTPS